MNFNKSVVATFVGAALTTMSLGAVASVNHTVNFGLLSSPTMQISNSNKANKIASMATQYNRNTGQSTFKWADKNESSPSLGGIIAERQLEYAADFYLNKAYGISTNKNSHIKAVLNYVHDTGRGARIAKYKQEVEGVEVFNRDVNILMDANLNLVATSGNFSTAKFSNNLSLLDFGSANVAINAAYKKLSGHDKLTATPATIKGKYQYYTVENANVSNSLRTKKVYFDASGKYIPAYYVEMEITEQSSTEAALYSLVVDAKSGKVLFKNNLTAYDQPFNYRVYADTDGINKPWQGPHGKVIPAEGPEQVDAITYLAAPMVTLSTGPISTKDAWLADDATNTQGNNVHAYVDSLAPDGFTAGDFDAEITSENTFDYKYDTSLTENSVHNRKAAIVNLFYMNNFLHDWYYDHGFDEASGNAQENNYGRGGIEGDSIRAEVQDNSGFNNANMQTPADGGRPIMQMYLWDSKDAINGEDYGITVTSNADIGQLSAAARSGFGQGQFSVSGDLVRIDDGFEDLSDPNNLKTKTDGCEAAVNGAALVGKIAIIDRGACNFTDKVKHAQDAGAIGAIIANNRDADKLPPLGGSDDKVTLPNMGITQEQAAEIYALMDAGDTVSINMFNNKPYKGSSWDNAIVSHEWGHYISNRLIGNGNGLSNIQGRSMGEGWGDFHALLMLANAKDAEIPSNETFSKAYAAISYVDSFYYGIRSYPYTPNMEINPLTFKNISLENGVSEYPAGTAEVHAAGTIWATALWDVYVALINKHGFNDAEKLMMDYLVAGYKMTPNAPTYTEARDAILSVAYANDPEDYTTIMTAFAKRGMGVDAKSPDRTSDSLNGVVESFEATGGTPSAIVEKGTVDSNYEGLTSGYCTNDNILDKGETGTVSFTVTNKKAVNIAGLTGKVEVVSGQDITLENDGMVTFDDIGAFANVNSMPIEFVLNDASTEDSLEFQLTFPDADPELELDNAKTLLVKVNYALADKELENFATTSDMESVVAGLTDWHQNVLFGGEAAKITQQFDDLNTDFLASQSSTDLGKQTMLLLNNPFQSDVAIESNEINVGYAGDFSMTWWHAYLLEENWDGGVVEISVNGSDWVDVTDPVLGGKFMNGYSSPKLIENEEQALQNRPVFTGRNNFGSLEAVNFGTKLNGSTVKLRFRLSSDGAARDFGWFIDNVQFTNVAAPILHKIVAGDSLACDNRLPFVNVVDSAEVKEGETTTLTVDASDPNGDALTYSWTQISGPIATITNADTATLTVAAPQVDVKTVLIFEVMVNDGKDSVVKSAKVTVNNIPEPTVTTKKSSGGGSTGLLALLLLPLAMFRRRK